MWGMIGRGLLSGIGTGLIGNLFGGGGSSPELMTADELRETQAPTQNLINEQISLSRAMMDPTSQQNQMMRNLLTQRASEVGAQTGSQAMKMAAMRGISPGQALAAQNQAMNQSMGGVNEQWQAALQDRFTQGVGVMGNMTTQQSKLDQPMTKLALANKAAQLDAYSPSAGGEGFLSQYLPKGFGSEFGTGQGGLSNFFGGIQGGGGFGSGQGWLANFFKALGGIGGGTP